MAMFAPLPLPNQAEQPLLFLGTVLHVDSFFAARNQALAQMLMVLLATLLAAAVLVFFLSRSLSRPISVMAEGAKAIRQGDFNTRLTVSSHDELGALAAEFNIMTSRLIETIASLRSAEVELKALNAELEAKVEARTIDLASANLELQAANQGLLRTLAELKEAQDKILVSEKLAVLGRLTAGIAHELNTPLAAISVSARLEMKVFSEGFDVLLTIASRLPREALALLEEARSGAAGRIGIPFAADPPRERRSRREAADVLSKAGIAEADSLADELSELDLASDVATLSPILAGPAGKDFMTLLRGVVGAYRAARIIEDAVEKASRVVAALRTYSRGGEDDAPVRVELAPLVQDVSGLCASRIHRNVELKISVPPGLEAFARREYLSQTCLNILINALQAVGESGTVEIEARKEDDTVLLLFTDTGPGIPARLQPRIFEPFFTTKLSGEGTGLGLDIARRLARADGGDIYFESQPGRTVFTVRLPAPSTPRIRM
jgi:C4-dicarboxylate-specific signal transduction histidine kinase